MVEKIFSGIIEDGVKEIVNIASANASTALSEMTGLLITVSVPESHVVSIYDFYNQFIDLMEEIVYGGITKLEGELDGYLVFFMDKKSVTELIQRLSEMFGEIVSKTPALDIIGEIYNIFASSYVTAIYKFLNIYATHTPPDVTEDFLGSIVNTVMDIISYKSQKKTLITVKVDLKIHKDDKDISSLFWVIHLMTDNDLEKISQSIMSL